MASNTDQILEERGRTHGDFAEHARITQSIKDIMRTGPSWERMSVEQHEALDMIAHKVGRACAGDPDHADHWADISGYSRLAEKSIDFQTADLAKRLHLKR